MAKFVFNLQPVLNARLAAERERQRAVASLERKRLALEERLRRQQAVIAANRDALRHDLIGTINATALRSHAGSSMRMMRDAQGMAVELAKIYESLDAARADLVQAAAARRALELLRDRRLAQWKRLQEKREAAMLDDLAGAKAARRKPHEETHA